MKKQLCFIIMFFWGVAFLFYSCGRDSKQSSEKLQITASILPQKYFIERIGNEYVKVNVMVEPGSNPATYEPKPEQLKALSRADAYFSIGVPFEKIWIQKIIDANPKMMIVDTTKGIQKMPIAEHHHEEEHSEARNLDPHIWLSPKLVKIQAGTIYEALKALDSKNKEVFKENLESFLEDIDELDTQIRESLSGLKNREFMVFHPSWGYFARDYGLEMIPVEVGGQEPSASELASFIKKAKENDIKIIFAQPEFSTKAAKTISQEIDGQLLLISPLSEDWLNNLLKVANTFSETLN